MCSPNRVTWVAYPANPNTAGTSSICNNPGKSNPSEGCTIDLATWPIGDQEWDLVAHVYLHWPTSVRVPFLRRCAAAVAPGGVLVIVGHDRDNIANGHGGPQDPDLLTTPDEQRALFEAAGLDVVRAERVTRSITLEPGHGGGVSEGTSSTVDAIDHVVVAQRPR